MKLDYLHDTCRCGNIKCKISKTCRNCHVSGKHRQISRMRKGKKATLHNGKKSTKIIA